MLENNPITDGSLTHFLNFKVPNYGEFQITEPIGFDAFTFQITQGKDRFGRDKEIGGGDEADLTFSDVYGKECEPFIAVDGSVITVLTHRLDLILKAIEEKGAETQIEYILKKDGVSFTTGLVDVSESDTDTYKYFNCTIVQNTNKALIERKKDVVVDVFSKTDTFNNYIAPLSKEKILLKAKPVFQYSEWGVSDSLFSTIAGYSETTIWNNLQNVVEYGVEDSFSFFDLAIYGDSSTPKIKGVGKIITAKAQLTNINVKYNFNVKYTGFVHTPSVYYDPMQFALKVFKTTSDSSDWLTQLNNAEIIYLSPVISDNDTETLDLDLDFTFPLLNSGENLYVIGQTLSIGAAGSTRGVSFEDLGSILNITATSTSVDSIIYGVSEYNFWKQGIKSLSGLDIDAELLRNNKYVFNGNLIRQKDDAALNFKFSDEANDLMIFKHDYQINDDYIEIKTFPDFYQNIDMGFYESLPEEGFTRKYNDRFKRITTTIGFKTYQQNKDEENTIDAVHTEAQFLFPITQEEGDETAKMNGIYDPFEIEFSRKEAINSTTSLSTDDKIFKIDTIEIPEGTMGIYKGVLQMRALDPYTLEILSNGFDWTLLGFENGDSMTITGENAGLYAILQHSSSLLELVRDDETLPPFTGSGYVQLEYPLTGVSLMNRTSEGFDLIEGIAEPDNFSNLIYTIKRILSNESWGSYLSTICKYNNGETILNTDFKVNGELATQLNGGDVLTENADIIVEDNRILNKFIYNTSIAVSFQNAKQLIEDAKTIKGFIRILDPLGRVTRVYLQDMQMTWATGIMEILGEGKNEVDFISIQAVSGGIKIYDVGYNEVIDTSLNWFKSDNGYFQFFDNDNNPLINPTYFDKIQIDGNFYVTDYDLYNKLLSL